MKDREKEGVGVRESRERTSEMMRARVDLLDYSAHQAY